MLKTRIMTALVLVGLFLPAVFFLDDLSWAVLAALFLAIGAWEWGGLLGFPEFGKRCLGAGFFLLCLLVLVSAPLHGLPMAGQVPVWSLMVYAAASLFWLALVPFWLRHRWRLSRWGGVAVGVIVLFPAWMAMMQLRALGPALLLMAFALVWVADIAAYFSGRRFGKRKLAPSISPGKTLEGAVGAIVGVMLYGLLLVETGVLAQMSGLWLVPALLLLTLLSIEGDLFESLLKRHAGLKDSSHVLPGHGGVLDRLDSLTSTLPLFALLVFLTGAFPG